MISAFDSRHGQEMFSFSEASRPALGPTQSINQGVPGSPSPTVMPPGNKADKLAPYNIQDHSARVYTFTLLYTLTVRCLIKHRENFTLLSLPNE